MKAILFILMLLSVQVKAQNKFALIAQELEQYLEQREDERDYTELIAGLEAYLNHPLNVNKATAEEMSALFFLSDVQILALLKHRESYGDILDLLELQLIPGWDERSIRLAKNFLSTGYENGAVSLKDAFARSRMEIYSLSSMNFPGSSEATEYMGSNLRSMLKFKSVYSNILSFGFSAEKDAGERFGFHRNTVGFDFLSAHFYHAPLKFLQAYLIGDYQLSFGQGLSLGSGISLGKSADISSLSRNLNGFRPYSSLNESEFLRGAAIRLAGKRLESNICFSRLKVDGRANSDGSFTLYNSGYHRTAKELELKGKVARSLLGINLTYRKAVYLLGFNVALSALTDAGNFRPGKNVRANSGVYYKYMFRNLAFAGEIGLDQARQVAGVHHLTGSLGPKLDICLLFRHYPQHYRALFSNAISSGSSNANEKAFYSGISFKFSRKVLINAYAELSRSDGLKYQSDAPSRSIEQLCEVRYQKSRNLLLILRLKNDGNEKNADGTNYHRLEMQYRRSFRMQLNYKLNSDLEFRLRYEEIRVSGINENASGSLIFQDFIYKPLLGKYSMTLRLASFRTESWDARIYAYEAEIPNAYSVPALNGQGMKYYILFNYNISKKLEAWIRISTIQYADSEILSQPAIHKSEFRFQLRYIL